VRVVIATRIFAPEPAAAAFRLTGRIADPEIPGLHPGVRVRRAPVLRDASGSVRGYVPYLTFDVPLLFRLLFRRRPDVVLAEPPPTTGFVVRLVCGLRRIPYAYYAADIWTHALESTTVPRPIVRAVSTIERVALNRAAAVIAVSDEVGATVRRLAPAAHVEVIENGVDTGVFRIEGPRVADGPFAVYAGTTSEWQGADVFVRAMPAVLAEVPGARLVFVGQGSAWRALQQASTDAGVAGSVQFVDQVPAGEAATWLRSARAGLVSLHPGQGYDFAVPTKLLAGAATGTPVLFAGDPAGPAARLVLEARLGRVVSWNPGSVAEGLVDLLADEPAAADRERRAAWVRRHASLRRTGERAAVVLHDVGDRAG
jgi:glycosyltransferase involved in cell wall biosynthesis